MTPSGVAAVDRTFRLMPHSDSVALMEGPVGDKKNKTKVAVGAAELPTAHIVKESHAKELNSWVFCGLARCVGGGSIRRYGEITSC